MKKNDDDHHTYATEVYRKVCTATDSSYKAQSTSTENSKKPKPKFFFEADKTSNYPAVSQTEKAKNK
ncbi:MAG: hypothetical protein IIT46_05075 [Lachnospiraceae bacterium]|nr:hypothetical protein [Lachnospiraceae bacterium]